MCHRTMVVFCLCVLLAPQVALSQEFLNRAMLEIQNLLLTARA